MIIYRRLEPEDLASLRCFLADNGWSKRVADDDRFRAMIDGADRTDSITWVLRAGRESRGFWGKARLRCFENRDGTDSAALERVAIRFYRSLF